MIPEFNPRWGKEPNYKNKRRVDKGTHLGWKWWRLRKEWLRDNPYCQRCGLFGQEVHHIIPRHIDKTKIYDKRNLMTLCSICHMKEHGMGERREETNAQSNQLSTRPEGSTRPDRPVGTDDQ